MGGWREENGWVVGGEWVGGGRREWVGGEDERVGEWWKKKKVGG
jgi:hypothetical protein